MQYFLHPSGRKRLHDPSRNATIKKEVHIQGGLIARIYEKWNGFVLPFFVPIKQSWQQFPDKAELAAAFR